MSTSNPTNNLADSLGFLLQMEQSIENEYRILLDFVADFKNQSMKEKRTLPYHINVIDMLHIDENSHSRILYQLLRFVNDKGEFEILNSLLDYIQRLKCAEKFGRIVVKRPRITQEKARIDLWIRDSQYAIIFENKIYNANDQEAQLARYIDRTRAENYEEEEIYVVYLSQTDQAPDKQSWGRYQTSFADRYVNLSFRNHILPWLKGDVLPNVRQKDAYLQSALVQYIDYLEGLFAIRNINETMNMKLDQLISDQLELDKCKDDKERVCLLADKIKDLQALGNQMEALKNSIRQNIFKAWRDEVKKKYPNLEEGYPDDFAGISLRIDGKETVIRINNDSQLYCQAEFSNSLSDQERLIAGSSLLQLADLLPRKNPTCVWRYFDIHDYDGVYRCFLRVVDRCLTLADRT